MKHSCTPGINNSVGMCIESANECTYTPGNIKTLKFVIEVSPNADKHVQIHQLRFFEKSPLTYSWINGNSGTNNYPQKFAFRVLKNNVEVYKETDIATLRDWKERKWDFTQNEAFTVKEKATYQFEFLPYCPIGNTSTVSVWDVEQLSIFTSCTDKKTKILSGKLTLEKSNINAPSIVVNKFQNLELANTTTDATGVYTFKEVDTNSDCVIHISKDDDHLNGIQHWT